MDKELRNRGTVLCERLDSLARALMEFWTTKGVDREHGGFHASLDRAGTAKEPTEKGLIQQSRHLWTYSTWYRRREPAVEIRNIANSTYAFIVSSMLDRDDEFFFKVSRDGSEVVDAKKQLYAGSFAVFGLAAYGRAFGVAEAKERALCCFRAFDRRTHDAEHGGYDQRRDPGWLSPGAQKETNTHIHLLEALTELHRATSDDLVRERLQELATVTATKLFQSQQGYVHKEFLRDWSPFGPLACSYGHDIETAWLLMDAAEALGQLDDPVFSAAALGMARHASDAGFDETHGGLFEEGLVGAGPTKLNKVWWIQFEALAGLALLTALSREERHWARFERTLSFIERHLYDAEHGECYWETSQDGRDLGPRGADKGEEWKTSYHSVRALVLASDWLRDGRCPGSRQALAPPL